MNAKLPSFRLFSLALLSMAAVSAGCSLPQGEACKQYIDCQALYDETYALAATDVSSYEEGGSCWRSESAAAGCEESCSVASERLKVGLQDSGDEVGACGKTAAAE